MIDLNKLTELEKEVLILTIKTERNQPVLPMTFGEKRFQHYTVLLVAKHLSEYPIFKN